MYQPTRWSAKFANNLQVEVTTNWVDDKPSGTRVTVIPNGDAGLKFSLAAEDIKPLIEALQATHEIAMLF